MNYIFDRMAQAEVNLKKVTGELRRQNRADIKLEIGLICCGVLFYTMQKRIRELENTVEEIKQERGSTMDA